MKHIFILNGSVKDHPFKEVIKDVMKDYDYEIIFTQDENHAMEASKQFRNEKYRVYSVGGDGLLNKVIQGMVNTDNELVVIPYGTGNDFHRYLNNEKDSRKVLEQSLTKEAIKVDCAKMNDRYYINSCCFGIDSVIANGVHVGFSIPFIPDYVLGIIKNILTYNNRHIKIYDENQVYFDDKMLLCTINNGKYYGGGFMITPKGIIDDGMLNLCVVDGIPRWKIPYLLLLLVMNKLAGRKDDHYFDVKHLYVDCEYSCNLDGDELKCDKYEITVLPKSINIVA